MVDDDGLRRIAEECVSLSQDQFGARLNWSYAVEVFGVIGFPFSTVSRVLDGEPFKSVASFGRVFPAIRDQSG